ncbi:hypothetical protein NDU88_007361 [Pleurodeles waltl]|uniref:Reverse transcriptase domain-containing protein n=1 Tax=Pleurodeles waltl TaxID=8319 RepID=A0AAV7SSB2_PLEWA|nr:hypothetical protein NDU88_007361 [Pleurodeles waltl]
MSNHNPNSDPEESEEEEQPGNEGPEDQQDQVTRVLQEMRVLASVMESSPPPSPATVEKEEASMEEEDQSLPANLEEEEPETSQILTSPLLAEYISKNPSIRGIPTPADAKKEVKRTLYMDDVTVFCADGKSVQSLLEGCKDFGKASWSKINVDKSQAKLFGCWRLRGALKQEMEAHIPYPNITHLSVLYGLFPKTHSVEAIQGCWRILCCIKDILLYARTRLVTNGEVVSREACRRMLHNLLRDYTDKDNKEREKEEEL